jgi:hypothetical protein
LGSAGDAEVFGFGCACLPPVALFSFGNLGTDACFLLVPRERRQIWAGDGGLSICLGLTQDRPHSELGTHNTLLVVQVVLSVSRV